MESIFQKGSYSKICQQNKNNENQKKKEKK